MPPQQITQIKSATTAGAPTTSWLMSIASFRTSSFCPCAIRRGPCPSASASWEQSLALIVLNTAGRKNPQVATSGRTFWKATAWVPLGRARPTHIIPPCFVPKIRCSNQQTSLPIHVPLRLRLRRAEFCRSLCLWNLRLEIRLGSSLRAKYENSDPHNEGDLATWKGPKNGLSAL